MPLLEYRAIYNDQIEAVALYSSDLGVIPGQVLIDFSESIRPVNPGSSGTVPNVLISRIDDQVIYSQVNGYALISMDGPYVSAADIIPALDEASPAEIDQIQEALDIGLISEGYVFSKVSPATVWTVAHNLGIRPSVQTFSVGGVEMFGDVQHLSDNTLTITFSVALAGTARLT